MRDDDFFKNTPSKTLKMNGESVDFPVLYFDFRFVTCVFTVKINRLKTILPHPDFVPIQVWPGTGMLAITAFEYRDTSIGPYNEVAISVPINFPPATFLGKHSALSIMRRNIYPVYIHHLPVTTEIARKGGVYYYNYPKFIAEIDFQEQNGFLVVYLKEKDELILRMSAKKIPIKKSDRFEFHTFSLKDNAVLHSLIEGLAPKTGQKILGRCGKLELGSHLISRELESLKPNQTAWSGTYGEGTMSKLYDPDKQWDRETLVPI
jgi:hypothetical protein